jgi:two-component system LytT family response regulator
MPKVKAIIIDDEPGNIATLTKMVAEYCTDVELLATANDIHQAEKLIHLHQPDLIFLDIEMPHGNGFDLLNNLAPINFEVVFVTAFNAYAIQAFKYSAVDYILKPVSINDLKNAVIKVKSRIEKHQLNERIDSLLSNMKTEASGRKKIGIPTLDGIVFEQIDDIIFLESDNTYTTIFFKNKRKEITSKSLGELEELLPQKIFCRIHKSYVININYIKKYYKGRGGNVIMEDGTSIEVSVRKKDEFLRLLES